MGVRDHIDRKANEWVGRLVARLGPDDAIRFGNSLLATIDDVSASRWDAAKERAASLDGSIRPERVEALTRSMAQIGRAHAELQSRE